MQGILNKIIEMDFFVKVRKPKADWHAIDSPKMRTKEIGFFAMTVRKYFKLEISISSLKYFQTVKQKKTNWFVWFLGESTMCLSAYGFIWPLETPKNSNHLIVLMPYLMHSITDSLQIDKYFETQY